MLNNERGIRKDLEGKKYYSLQAITRDFMNKNNTKFAHDFADTLTMLKVFDKHYIVRKSKDMWKDDTHVYVYLINDNFRKFIEGQYIEENKGFWLDEDACEIVVTIYNRFKEEKVNIGEFEDFVLRNISLVKVRQENR